MCILKRVVYVYLLGLSVANLCALIACVPAFIDVAFGLGHGSYVIAFYKVNGLSIIIILPSGRLTSSGPWPIPSVSALGTSSSA